MICHVRSHKERRRGQPFFNGGLYYFAWSSPSIPSFLIFFCMASWLLVLKGIEDWSCLMKQVCLHHISCWLLLISYLVFLFYLLFLPPSLSLSPGFLNQQISMLYGHIADHYFSVFERSEEVFSIKLKQRKLRRKITLRWLASCFPMVGWGLENVKFYIDPGRNLINNE